jgi:voltage-gated potassium channel Kch
MINAATTTSSSNRLIYPPSKLSTMSTTTRNQSSQLPSIGTLLAILLVFAQVYQFLYSIPDRIVNVLRVGVDFILNVTHAVITTIVELVMLALLVPVVVFIYFLLGDVVFLFIRTIFTMLENLEASSTPDGSTSSS